MMIAGWWNAALLCRDINLIAVTARKEMARTHGVDPHRYKS